jgi:hypothetical protein
MGRWGMFCGRVGLSDLFSLVIVANVIYELLRNEA